MSVRKGTSSALARGLLKLALKGRLAEGELLRACGLHPRAALEEGLRGLEERGLIERHARGRGARWEVAEGRRAALLAQVAGELSPRARIAGSLVRELLALLPAPASDDLATRILAAVDELGRGTYGGMVSLPELVARLGLPPGQLEAPLRALARSGRLQLEPLSDPLSVPPEERALGLPDPVRGLLFYVSPLRSR